MHVSNDVRGRKPATGKFYLRWIWGQMGGGTENLFDKQIRWKQDKGHICDQLDVKAQINN